MKASPFNTAKRVGKVHPDQTNYWLMVFGPDERLNRHMTFISVYAGFGTMNEYPTIAAKLFEDWEPVLEEDDEALKLLSRFHRQTSDDSGLPPQRQKRWDEHYGHMFCHNCNPIPPTAMHHIAQQVRDDD
jgi:hypothetical protein